MSSLFTVDWDTESATDQVSAPELAATLARLQIGVNSHYVTVAEDLHNGSIRRSINVALYPLAEWIVFNWWQLLFASRFESLDGNLASPSNRNSMRSIGDGFIWPNLSITPEGGMVHLSWMADPFVPQGRGIRFVTSGQERVSTDWIVESFVELVESVLIRLDEASIGETPLHKEWTAIRQLDEDEAEFCQACGRLGIDPFSDGFDLSRPILNVFSRLEPPIVWEFFDAANPERLDENCDWALRADALALSSRAQFDRDLLKRSREVPSDGFSGSRPYELGYLQARAVRKKLGLKPSSFFPVEDLSIQVQIENSNEPSLQGLTRQTADAQGAALIMGWDASENARRFSTCRAAWHLIFGNADYAFLLTSGTSQSQQTARAFAAELLAPAEGIRSMMGRGMGSISYSPMIADRFGVSETVIERQIENQVSVSSGSWHRI